MGSQRLYDFLDDNPSVLFKSCTFSNDPYTIGLNNKFVSINATLEIDLSGQCASETVGHHQWSGTGGQSETVQGAQMSKGGKSIIAMHSTYSTKDENGEEVLHSKIVPFLAEGAAVTTSRNDVDYVVTEYGIAWLRGLNLSQRVDALISIAHPDFRDWLREEAEKNMIW
jgi:acyl-CoA hydrolase